MVLQKSNMVHSPKLMKFHNMYSELVVLTNMRLGKCYHIQKNPYIERLAKAVATLEESMIYIYTMIFWLAM